MLILYEIAQEIMFIYNLKNLQRYMHFLSCSADLRTNSEFHCANIWVLFFTNQTLLLQDFVFLHLIPEMITENLFKRSSGLFLNMVNILINKKIYQSLLDFVRK